MNTSRKQYLKCKNRAKKTIEIQFLLINKTIKMNNDVPLKQCALEEIALEGLEGITIEGFWQRLAIRLNLKHPLSTNFQTTIWRFLQSQKCIQYYELLDEREPLKFYDRADLVEPDTGMPIEPVKFDCIIKLFSLFAYILEIFNYIG